jgi:hypothetical protein
MENKRFALITGAIICVAFIAALSYVGCGGGGSSDSGSSAATEVVSAPTTPTGPTSGTTGISYTYTTGGAVSDLAHPVEYQFDWKGDGSVVSLWGSASMSGTWSTAATYSVRARARCVTDTLIVSSWSAGLAVVIPASGDLVPGFGAGGVVTSNPTTMTDSANLIAVDATYMYVVGVDYVVSETNDTRWRIEKRLLTTGALESGFGTAGIVTGNPSTSSDVATAISIDSTYMYVVGLSCVPGTNNFQWRIEKRLLTTGALDSGFGTAGIITGNKGYDPTVGLSIATDATYMYVAGYDAPNYSDSTGSTCRIEKRLLTTGALDTGFDTDGVVTRTVSTAIFTKAIAIDSTYMYVAGSDFDPGNLECWVEKRALSDGALDTSFDTDGVITSNPSTSSDVLSVIAISGTYMYLAGFDSVPGDREWRVEKRNLSDGALVGAFGTGGVVNVDMGSGYDSANALSLDGAYMYLAGDDYSTNGAWRIEKRLLTTGALDSGFGTAGVVTSNPSSNEDRAKGIVLDSTYIYVVGDDSSVGVTDSQWRIEKRLK